MTHLKDKSVIVTGASRGIGEATARYFADQGASVVLAARSEDRISRIAHEIKKTGGTASAVPCDVSRYDQVRDLIDHAVARHGRIDIIINNAGLIDPISRLADSDPEAWAHIVDVNYKGVYYGLRTAIPHMVAQGGGTVINISSGAATGALEGWSHYCSTKAAVLSLTRCADKEYRDSGVRVIGLSPGTVATEMQVQIKTSGINPVSRLDASAHIPPEWVARTIAYLCSSAADRHRGTDFSLKTEEGRLEAGLVEV